MNFSFKNLIGSVTGSQNLPDPSSFNDPLALKVSWEPLKGGGTNFRTHKAMLVRSDRFEFRTTLLMKLFPLFFIVIPSLVLFAFVKETINREGKLVFQGNLLFVVPVALIFFAVAGYMIFLSHKAIIFDRNYGYFWKGKSDKQGMVINPADQKESVKLSEIHALQIVSEWVSGSGKNNRPYKSYELNLVLKSGERMNVIDHGNRVKLVEDATMLAQFLNVPLWDRTSIVA